MSVAWSIASFGNVPDGGEQPTAAARSHKSGDNHLLDDILLLSNNTHTMQTNLILDLNRGGNSAYPTGVVSKCTHDCYKGGATEGVTAMGIAAAAELKWQDVMLHPPPPLAPRSGGAPVAHSAPTGSQMQSAPPRCSVNEMRPAWRRQPAPLLSVRTVVRSHACLTRHIRVLQDHLRGLAQCSSCSPTQAVEKRLGPAALWGPRLNQHPSAFRLRLCSV